MSADRTAGDEGFDDWLDAVEAGEAFYLACPEGHGSLPPRRACPHCGSPDLTEEPLPDSGPLETFTVVHVAGPSFVDETPYATGVAAFGPARVTGVVRGPDPDDVETGLPVGATVEENATTGERLVVLRPR